MILAIFERLSKRSLVFVYVVYGGNKVSVTEAI